MTQRMRRRTDSGNRSPQNGEIAFKTLLDSSDSNEHIDDVEPADLNLENGGQPEMDEIEEDMRCGYFAWTPDALQKLNRPGILLACLCWFTFTQG